MGDAGLLSKTFEFNPKGADSVNLIVRSSQTSYRFGGLTTVESTVYSVADVDSTNATKELNALKVATGVLAFRASDP